MNEKRSTKVTVMLTPSVAARLDAYAERFRWSRSNAIAVLVEEGLQDQGTPTVAGQESHD